MKKELLALVLFSLLLVGLASAGILQVTNEHPFLINGNWISASQLQVGDLMTTIDGKKARITGIEQINQPVQVYNLEDDIFHNYVVTDDNLIVHNSDTPGSTRPVPGRGITERNLPAKTVKELLLPRDALHIANLHRLLVLEINNLLTGEWEGLLGRDIMAKLKTAIDEHDIGKMMEVYQVASNKLADIKAANPDCYRELPAWKLAYDELMSSHSFNPFGSDMFHHNPQLIASNSLEAVAQTVAGVLDWFETATSDRLGAPKKFSAARAQFETELGRPLMGDVADSLFNWKPAQKFNYVLEHNQVNVNGAMTNIRMVDLLNLVEKTFKSEFPDRF